MSSAETAYLFRHAVLRDAAYQLQTPSARTRLHGFAADLVAALPGARGALAQEVALHLRLAGAHPDRESEYSRLAAEYAESRHEYRTAITFWVRAAELSPDNDAELLRSAGRAAVQCSHPQAEELVERCLKQASAKGNELIEGLACSSMGNLLQQTGRVEQAIVYHQKSLELFRRLGNRKGEGTELGNIGNLWFRLGRLEDAVVAHQHALTIHREIGNALGVGVTLSNLAGVYQHMERFNEAEETFREGLTVLQSIGDARSLGITLANYGNLLAAQDRYEEALKALSAALPLVRETGNRRFEGNVLGSLGALLQLMRGPGDAIELLEQAVAIHAEVRNINQLAYHGVTLACALVQVGKRERAQRHYRNAMAHAAALLPAEEIQDFEKQMHEACAAAGIAPLDAAQQGKTA
ncbi:MAG: tetratricopeptide repeat protein [Planctomycetes bacterium]|nr:tetratricopeptide repeat protein [Planctomycetota bacterium]MCW8136958.1 tetratricopeptide repeat protein [Planctomycetota bacterium]